MTLYKVTGEAYCKKIEDDFEYQAAQFIEQPIDCVDLDAVGQASLSAWLTEHGWSSGHWIDGPFITELPADQVMVLARAERLPGI